jgi:hypothetical protein
VYAPGMKVKNEKRVHLLIFASFFWGTGRDTAVFQQCKYICALFPLGRYYKKRLLCESRERAVTQKDDFCCTYICVPFSLKLTGQTFSVDQAKMSISKN